MSNIEDIKRYLKSNHSATWGRSFDLTNNLDEAAAYFDKHMTGYFDMLDAEAPLGPEAMANPFWDNEATQAAEAAILNQPTLNQWKWIVTAEPEPLIGEQYD